MPSLILLMLYFLDPILDRFIFKISFLFLEIMFLNQFLVLILFLCCAVSLSHVQLFATAWTIAHHPLYPSGISRQEYWSGLPRPPPWGSSQPRDWTQVSHIADFFFTSWPQGKTKNTRVGSLSLLQGIFLTQESNWGILHCRWILYQWSYQGSPSSGS